MTLYPRREVVPVLLRLAKRRGYMLVNATGNCLFCLSSHAAFGPCGLFFPKKCHIPPANYGLLRANYGL